VFAECLLQLDPSLVGHAKLVLAGVAILSTAGLVFTAAGQSRAYVRAHRAPQGLMEGDTLEYRPDCSQPDACLNQKYATRLLAATGSETELTRAAHDFCAVTTWAGGTAEHLVALITSCEAATRERMARDLSK
jgi:hypothetical protein